jgi:NAD(P)-dependent dehydrogenase (short-subunit alcohol dehydrogenase family)
MAVVLVTGGSSGIGLATVRRLAASGDTVFSASREPGRTELPEGVTPLVFDLADRRGAQHVLDEVVRGAGRLDALVNNAGVAPIIPLEEMDDEQIQHVLDVNLIGPMRLARAAVPVMRAAGGGRIVNVTSLNDVLPSPFAGWYSGSKAALASLSAALDAEVHGFGIRVSVVAPGLFRTPMAESLADASVDASSPYRKVFDARSATDQTRLESAGDPDEVATVIEQCIREEDPPSRVVVGADAIEISKQLASSDANALGQYLRAGVARLNR